MFKVSKQPYQCTEYDVIIFSWCDSPSGGEKLNVTILVKTCATLIAILPYLEAKFDYGYSIILFALWL